MTKYIVLMILLISMSACHAGFGIGDRHRAANDALESAMMQANLTND